MWRHKRWQNGQNYLEKEEKNLMYYTPSFQAILQSCNSENSTVLSKKKKKTHRSVEWNACMLSLVQLFVTPWTVPGSFVHGIFQARILEWVAISLSKWVEWWPTNICIHALSLMTCECDLIWKENLCRCN